MPRSAGSSSSMISMARGFGAPESVPAGNADVNTSNDVMSGLTRPVTVEQMCIMWLNRLISIKDTTSTLSGRHTRLRSLRERSTSMMCSLRSFGSASRSLASCSSSSIVVPRGLEPAIGKVMAWPLSTLISVSGLDPITLKSRPCASVNDMKYMYGLGLNVRARGTRRMDRLANQCQDAGK